jgi:hypothetical protein
MMMNDSKLDRSLDKRNPENRFNYLALSKKEKGLIRIYLKKITSYFRA